MSLAAETAWYDEHHRRPLERLGGRMDAPEPPQTPWSRVLVGLCLMVVVVGWLMTLAHAAEACR